MARHCRVPGAEAGRPSRAAARGRLGALGCRRSRDCREGLADGRSAAWFCRRSVRRPWCRPGSVPAYCSQDSAPRTPPREREHAPVRAVSAVAGWPSRNRRLDLHAARDVDERAALPTRPALRRGAEDVLAGAVDDAAEVPGRRARRGTRSPAGPAESPEGLAHGSSPSRNAWSTCVIAPPRREAGKKTTSAASAAARFAVGDVLVVAISSTLRSVKSSPARLKGRQSSSCQLALSANRALHRPDRSGG